MEENEGADGQTQLFGLFAHPAGHSLSPLMHNTSFQHYHLNAKYLGFDLQPAQLASAIEGIRIFNFGGVNLSMPFKQQVIPLLDQITPRAKQLNSVNVITNHDGLLIGDSVDGEGFFYNLANQKIKVAGETMTLFGAGGAGLSIVQAAIDQHLKEIFIFKRHNQTFDQVAQQLKELAKNQSTRVNLIDYADEQMMIQAIQVSTIIVNSTNLGMDDYVNRMPAPPGVLQYLKPQQIVCDVIYAPLETKFLAYAKNQGCQTFNGLGMLIYQGALSFKKWTNQSMPIKTVQTAIQRQLQESRK